MTTTATAALPRDLTAYRQLLQERFGYPDFRSGQAEVLQHLSTGDVLAVMPTGGGKSLCYALPALVAGRTLVVSPLIALMQDQVRNLEAAGVPSGFINSTIDRDQQNQRYLDFRSGKLKLLYVAPERFANEKFVEGLRAAGLTLLAIDEAHCVSEWGHDFRPDYLALGSVRHRLGSPRTLALTATADPKVRLDILKGLGLAATTKVVATSVDRPNLQFSVMRIPDPDERTQWVVSYVKERKGQSGIVYVRTRKGVEEMAAELKATGIKAGAYHAGMPAEERSRVQDRFTKDEAPLIAATNAFGMGVDKPDVRFVVHYNMPGRIESYYQQAGRSGRDGGPADCVLLFGPREASAQRWFIDQAHPSDPDVRAIWARLVDQVGKGGNALAVRQSQERAEDEGAAMAIAAFRASGLIDAAGRLATDNPDARIDTSTIAAHRRHCEERLEQMVAFARARGCRRAIILRYFGDTAPDSCTGCDNCLRAARRRAAQGADGWTEGPAAGEETLLHVLLALRESLARSHNMPPYQVFESRTVEELALYRPRGRDDLLDIWGIGKTRQRMFGAAVLEAIGRWEAEHPEASPPPRPTRSRQHTAHDAQTEGNNAAARRPARGAGESDDETLYGRLRAWRIERVHRDGVPAYVVFPDRVLREIVARRPASVAALAAISGVGEAKLRLYGEEVLRIVRGSHSTPADGG